MGKKIVDSKDTKTKAKEKIIKRKEIEAKLDTNHTLKKIFTKELINKAKLKAIEVEVKPEEKLPNRNLVRLSKIPCKKKQIREGVSALYQLIKRTQTKPELFDEEQPIFLQVTCVKIPQTPIRHIRFHLKHSLLTDSSEICLIVGDKGKKRDHDGTIEYYEEILNNNGITNVKTIIPYNQFKSEYTQFELKRKLLGLYDYFLVDGRVSGYVRHILGSIFYESRKMPTIVKMDAPQLKEHFEHSLNQTIMKMHSKGDSYALQIGHSFMPEEHVFENINELLEDFRNQFPGGVENVRGLGLKMNKSLTIPIFLTLKNKRLVNVPICKPQLPKHHKTVTDELSTFINKRVFVSPDGKIRVRKGPTKKDMELKRTKKEIEDKANCVASDDESEPEILPELASLSKINQNEADESSDEENGKLMRVENDYLNYYEQEYDQSETKERASKKRKTQKKSN